MNTRRISSMNLMRDLQPFLQGGVITPAYASSAVKEYINGEIGLIKNLAYNPDIPVAFNALAEKLKNYIQ